MRRALRQIGAIIAILFILFMNVGSFALHAYAAGGWDVPKWDVPKWDAPEGEVPTWEAPTWEVEEWELSEWNAPEWENPNWELSEWKAPEWNASEWVVPNSESPSNSDSATQPGGNKNPANNKQNVKPGNKEIPADSSNIENKVDLINPNNTDKEIENKPFDFNDNVPYELLKFGVDSILFPAISGLDKDLVDISWEDYKKNYKQDLLKSVIKETYGKTLSDGTAVGIISEIGLDVWTGYDHVKGIGKFFKSADDIRDIYNAARTGGSFATAASDVGSFFTKITKPLDFGGGIAGKAAPWMAVVSTAVSSAETVMSFANKEYNDGFASLGETLMSGAVVLSATGVGAPIAAGVAVVGGLLWAGAKVYKHRKSIKKYVSKTVDNVKKGFKVVKGWFGK